jgi:hypothetical protein
MDLPGIGASRDAQTNKANHDMTGRRWAKNNQTEWTGTAAPLGVYDLPGSLGIRSFLSFDGAPRGVTICTFARPEGVGVSKFRSSDALTSEKCNDKTSLTKMSTSMRASVFGLPRTHFWHHAEDLNSQCHMPMLDIHRDTPHGTLRQLFHNGSIMNSNVLFRGQWSN